VTDQASSHPRDRIVLQLTEDQRGWIVAALIVFLGVAVLGPRYARASERARLMRREAAARMRHLRHRAMAPVRHMRSH
jgi:hypothetical protein